MPTMKGFLHSSQWTATHVSSLHRLGLPCGVVWRSVRKCRRLQYVFVSAAAEQLDITASRLGALFGCAELLIKRVSSSKWGKKRTYFLMKPPPKWSECGHADEPGTTKTFMEFLSSSKSTKVERKCVFWTRAFFAWPASLRPPRWRGGRMAQGPLGDTIWYCLFGVDPGI